MEEKQTGIGTEIEVDREFARLVLEGNGGACKKFVELYTDWVLYRILELMKTHCKYSARDCLCCLHFLSMKKKGKKVDESGRVQCDECMDSYIWMFEYLKTKLRSYKGINNCSLKTYMWSIINSHAMFVDWLRWRYGRVF